ncbi:glycoside hydrolase family 76 [Colletotrichum tabaci]|uniref:Mannan endo-1,6-alpha-mannosidase n=1 Tax=Colletotrichum tabaci TaxID=1209068 RepID=A0AAV9T4E0_9PEZI
MFMSPTLALPGALLLLGSLPAAAAELKIDTRNNIVDSARSLAKDAMTFYKGEEPGKIPGLLPGPPLNDDDGDYWWYQGASFWATYLDYWHLTGDDTYTDTIAKGMLHQTGPNNDYMPPNQTANIGNDDQCFWGTAALVAAEYGFPIVDGKATWIDLAKAVWATQASPDRHDETCNGGLRWQIPYSNVGYDVKNTASNACFFNMGARLGRFTGNATYSEWADKTWDWLSRVGLIDSENWAVYDGVRADNCTHMFTAQVSYNAAMLVQGAAFMYNNTNGSDVWRERTEKLTESLLATFFPNGTAFEVVCEGRKGTCAGDLLWYKGYVHRWLSSATQLAPFLAGSVLPLLKTSAEAAVKQCVAGSSGLANRCGFYWAEGTFSDPQATDKTTGAGEAVNVLAAVSNLLVSDARAPITEADDKAGGPNVTGQDGSPSAASGTASPAKSTVPSGAGSIGVDMGVSLLIGSLMTLTWAF